MSQAKFIAPENSGYPSVSIPIRCILKNNGYNNFVCRANFLLARAWGDLDKKNARFVKLNRRDRAKSGLGVSTNPFMVSRVSGLSNWVIE